MTDTKGSYRPVVIVRGEINRDNSILMVKRSVTVTRPGEWELPGGKLDRGESIIEAAKRELAEECGLAVEIGDFITDWHKSDDELIGLVFEAEPLDDSEVVLSDEHEEYAWVMAENIDSIELTDVYKSYLINRLGVPRIVENNTTVNNQELVIFTDGGSRGNPGPSATGYVIYDTNQQELAQGGTYLGITTNNQAEYHALLEAAQAALVYEPSKIAFYLDSQLVVNQMNGKYKIRNKDLWPVHQSIKDTLAGMNFEFNYIPREENSAADAMVNKVLDDRKNPVE